jgi:L-rhamnose mutarotase
MLTMKTNVAARSKTPEQGNTKIFCQTLSLADDAQQIAKYCDAHANVWPEIKAGIKAVGIIDMELFLLGTQVVMVVVAPADFDWDTQMAKLAELPRQQEWEDYVASQQQCEKGLTSDQKWHMMRRIFALE